MSDSLWLMPPRRLTQQLNNSIKSSDRPQLTPTALTPAKPVDICYSSELTITTAYLSDYSYLLLPSFISLSSTDTFNSAIISRGHSLNRLLCSGPRVALGVAMMLTLSLLSFLVSQTAMAAQADLRHRHSRHRLLRRCLSLHLASRRLASRRLASLRLTSLHHTSPHHTSPLLTSRRLASPPLASPHLATPRLATLRLASPRLASPRLTSPHLAPLRLASPRIASLHPHQVCTTYIYLILSIIT